MNFTQDNKFYYSSEQYLNYREVGNGDKTILFLHGFGSSSRTWDDIVPYLDTAHFKYIFFDLIGFGFSTKVKIADYSMTANAAAIVKFIKDNAIDNYLLAGHSFGGGVALLATIQFIEEAKHVPQALILVDAAAYKTELPFFVKQLRIPFVSKLILSIMSPKLLARYTLNKIYNDKTKVTNEKVARYAFFMSLEGHNDTMIKAAKQIIPEGIQGYVNKYVNIDIPALIVWGRQDPALPLETGVRLSKQMPQAKLSIIDDCGHNTQEEQPAKTAHEINAFLNKVR